MRPIGVVLSIHPYMPHNYFQIYIYSYTYYKPQSLTFIIINSQVSFKSDIMTCVICLRRLESTEYITEILSTKEN